MSLVFASERLVLRPAAQADEPALAEILAEPAVAEHWEVETISELTEPEDDALKLVIEIDGRVAGYVQALEDNDPSTRHASIDVFLSMAHAGGGLGSEAVWRLARHLVDDRGHRRITIDPAAENLRAIRSYECVGFKPVGRMRAYCRTPDGRWVDGLLMDLLAEELPPGPPGRRPRASAGPTR